MANSVHWQLICLQILFTFLHSTVQDTDQGGKDIETKNVEVLEWTVQYNLSCIKESKPIWKKDGEIISRPINDKLPSYIFPLLCVEKSHHEGKYTCHAKENSPPLRRINVKVTGKGHPCGRPHKKVPEVEVGLTCSSHLVKYYPCCKRIPVAAERMDVVLQDIIVDSDDKCDIIYSGENGVTNPYNVIVNWKIDSLGSSGTWGWQINVIGLDGDAGRPYCAQINNKDKILNWALKHLKLEATYNITVQTLPESSIKPNARFKKITMPKLQDMCDTIGQNCSWEFCFPVENLTVANYSSSPLLSWRPSPFYKTRHVYEVIYWEENNSKEKFIVENGFQFNLTNLKDKSKYFAEVRPVFLVAQDDEFEMINGRSSKLVFYTAPSVGPPPPSPNHLKIIIFACVATVCLFFLSLLLVYRKLRRLKGKEDHENSNGPHEILISDHSTDVFLVHDNHCNSCDNATHLLANVLWETGRMRCFLDLCSTREIGKHGLRWYEERFKNCKKIVVICTKESKKTYENGHGSNANIYQQSFSLVLNMILGEIAHNNNDRNNSGNNNNIQVVPVCFDFSTSEDIPNFLRDRQFFSLPSGIEHLLLSLSDLNPRRIGDMAEYGLEASNELQRRISDWRNAIRRVERTHCRPGRGSLINYARSLSSSSADEPFRV